MGLGMAWHGIAEGCFEKQGNLTRKQTMDPSRDLDKVDSVTLGRVARNKEEGVTICGRHLVPSRDKHTSARCRSRGGIGEDEGGEA